MATVANDTLQLYRYLLTTNKIQQPEITVLLVFQTIFQPLTNAPTWHPNKQTQGIAKTFSKRPVELTVVLKAWSVEPHITAKPGQLVCEMLLSS
jgi:hypothetical protein